MTRTGTITLLYREDFTSSKYYRSGTHRQKIINDWKTIYADRFNDCVIQIRPNVCDSKHCNTHKCKDDYSGELA